jgi:hypothetical protein
VPTIIPTIPTSDKETTTHQQQMALQQLLQLGRVMDLVGEAADIARIEIDQSPAPVGPGAWTRITGVLLRVEAATVIYERLGGDELPQVKEFASEGRRMRTPPESIVSEATSVLEMLKRVAENESFALN